LFADGAPRIDFDRTGTRTFAAGIVELRCRPRA